MEKIFPAPPLEADPLTSHPGSVKTLVCLIQWAATMTGAIVAFPGVATAQAVA